MGRTNVKFGISRINFYNITATLTFLVIILNVRGSSISRRRPLGTRAWRSNVAFKCSWDSDLN